MAWVNAKWINAKGFDSTNYLGLEEDGWMDIVLPTLFVVVVLGLKHGLWHIWVRKQQGWQRLLDKEGTTTIKISLGKEGVTMRQIDTGQSKRGEKRKLSRKYVALVGKDIRNLEISRPSMFPFVLSQLT